MDRFFAGDLAKGPDAQNTASGGVLLKPAQVKMAEPAMLSRTVSDGFARTARKETGDLDAATNALNRVTEVSDGATSVLDGLKSSSFNQDCQAGKHSRSASVEGLVSALTEGSGKPFPDGRSEAISYGHSVSYDALRTRLPRASHSMPLGALLEDAETGPVELAPPILNQRNPFLNSRNPFLAPRTPVRLEPLWRTRSLNPFLDLQVTDPALIFPSQTQAQSPHTENEAFHSLLADDTDSNPTLFEQRFGAQTSRAEIAHRPTPLRPWQSMDEAQFAAGERLLEAVNTSQRRRSLAYLGQENRADDLRGDVSIRPRKAADFGGGGVEHPELGGGGNEGAFAPARDMGNVWESYEGLTGSQDSGTELALVLHSNELAPAGGQVIERKSVKKWLKLPGRFSTWHFSRLGRLPPRKSFSTAFFALWAVGIMGVLPFVNTITNAWFLVTLYQPGVLACINFVEESPGADPSEFPLISGALLQALSWICVILGVIDIGDLLTRLALHLRKEGVRIWRVKPLVWTTVKWLMIEDEQSTHLGGYTHARFREFCFSTGADTIEVFVTASFLFWTGSGYPLATFSLFISLAAIYLTWSFEIAWHFWYLCRRFSPIWPHPTAVGVSPEDSATQLLSGPPTAGRGGKSRWFRWWRNKPERGRNAAETDRNEGGFSPEALVTGGELVVLSERSSGQSLEVPFRKRESNRQRTREATPTRERRRTSSDTTSTSADVSEVVSDLIDHISGPDQAEGSEAPGVRESVSVVKESVSGDTRAGSAPLRARQSAVRDRRSKSLENLDLEVGIIRTLSQASEQTSASAGSEGAGDANAGKLSQRGARRKPEPGVGNLVNLNPEGGAAGSETRGFWGRRKTPRVERKVGRGERNVFWIMRGTIVLGMIAALIISLWLADFGPGLLYGVGITYLTRISVQVSVRCEPMDSRGTSVDYVVPFNGSRIGNLNGVFFYYTASSNAYIFDSSDDELNSITEHDFVIGALSDRFIAYDGSGSSSKNSSGAIKVRFATVLHGVAMLISTSNAWASKYTNVALGHIPMRYAPLNQRSVFKYNTATWQTLPVTVHNFSVPIFCRSPYSNTTKSPLGRLTGLNVSVSMAGISCYNPGNATFKLPTRGMGSRPPRTDAFY